MMTDACEQNNIGPLGGPVMKYCKCVPCFLYTGWGQRYSIL